MEGSTLPFSLKSNFYFSRWNSSWDVSKTGPGGILKNVGRPHIMMTNFDLPPRHTRRAKWASNMWRLSTWTSMSVSPRTTPRAITSISLNARLHQLSYICKHWKGNECGCYLMYLKFKKIITACSPMWQVYVAELLQAHWHWSKGRIIHFLFPSIFSYLSSSYYFV